MPFDGRTPPVVVGASLRTFLLERSRVTSTNSANERAYHIMYQVVIGTPLVGLPVEKVNYLSMSGCTTIDGVDDKKEFDDVSKAMTTVGMSADDTSNVWQCIAALIALTASLRRHEACSFVAEASANANGVPFAWVCW